MLLGRMLLLPSILLLALSIYWGMVQEHMDIRLILPACLLVVALFVFQHKINDYSLGRWPPKLDEDEEHWMRSYVHFYNNLSDFRKKEFGQNLGRVCAQTDFIAKGMESIPQEIKMMVIAPMIYMRLHENLQISENFKRVALYLHPFITPEQNYIHISEIHDEDGLLIFSLAELQISYKDPLRYFNSAFYEWSRIFFGINQHLKPTNMSDEFIWHFVAGHTNIEKERLEAYMGQPEIDTSSLLLYTCTYFQENIPADVAAWHARVKKFFFV